MNENLENVKLSKYSDLICAMDLGPCSSNVNMLDLIKLSKQRLKHQSDFISIYLLQFSRCFSQLQRMSLEGRRKKVSEFETELTRLEMLIRHSVKTLQLSQLDELAIHLENSNYKLLQRICNPI
jgi:hypothetical protein